MHAHMAGNVATRADLAELKDALTWRMLLLGLGLAGLSVSLSGVVIAVVKNWL